MTGPFIVVTGATGGLGSEVVRQLLDLAPAERIGVSVREPARAAGFALAGVRVRQGDFDHPESLVSAFQGADRVLVISTNSGGNAQRFVQQRNAIEAAHRAGATHVYYTSIVQRRGTGFLAAQGHHDTEAFLAASGMPHTVFRNGHYMENLTMFIGAALHTGVLELPLDGPTAWVSRVDLAEGIARRLLGPSTESECLAMTGPQALTFTDIAGIITEVCGTPITRRVIDSREYVRRLVAQDVAPVRAEMLASGFLSRAANELAAVDPTLQTILGRPLRTIEGELRHLFRR